MNELQGKVALITGAGRGFGRAIGERFAEAGASLALNYRASAAGCEEVAEQARAMGSQAITVQADVSDGSAVEAMVARVIDELGRIDILVNNAGIMYLEPFVASSE
jgi:3-oxoacyl-[acyl-carrier protein] reductase